MNLADFFVRNNYFNESQLFLGLDLGKKTSQLCVLDPNGKELANFAFASTAKNFVLIAKALRKNDHIAMEVSNPANAVMAIFKKHSKAKAVLSNPLFTRAISKARVKSDREDARKLADLNRINYLETVWSPDEDTLRLRHLITDREALVKHRTAIKNQVHSVLARNLIEYQFTDLFGSEGREWLRSLLLADELDSFERDRISFLLGELDRQNALTEDVDKLIASFIHSRPVFSHQLDLLLSIPGVSLAVSATILAAIGDISRFSSKRKFACYFGLTQRIKQTGGKPPRPGKISKQGNSYARFMLIEAAEHFRRSPVIYRNMYQRIKKKKGHNVAIVAVARRLAEVIYSMLSKNEEFIYARPRLMDEKRARIRKLARDKASLNLKRRPSNTIIRGTALRGRELKEEIFKRAADEALKIKDLIGLGKRLSDVSPTGFNPNKPNHIDWQKLLKEVATTYAKELAAKKKKSKAPA